MLFTVNKEIQYTTNDGRNNLRHNFYGQIFSESNEISSMFLREKSQIFCQKKNVNPSKRCGRKEKKKKNAMAKSFALYTNAIRKL